MEKEKPQTYKVEQVAIGNIRLRPVFAMRNFKDADVESLAISIKQQGLINPLLVRKLADGYELISGHRRLLALRKLKADTVAAHVIEATDEQAFVLALTENIERRDPNPMEEAHAFQRAMTELKMTADAIGKQVGRDSTWVLKRIQLLDLDDQVQAAVQEGTVSATMAQEAFLKLKHRGDQTELLKSVKQDIRGGNIPTAKNAEEEAKRILAQRAEIEAVAKCIQSFGDKVKFKRCPTCGLDPDPTSYQMNLKKGHLHCTRYNCPPWHPVTGVVKPARETTLDGNVRSGTPVKGGESVVKVEADGHRSHLTVQQFFDKLVGLIMDNKAAIDLKLTEDWMGMNAPRCLELSVHIDTKKLADLPTIELEAKTWKTCPQKTAVTLAGGNWGGNNKNMLKQRELFWKLEKSIMRDVIPAEIVRVPLERLVIDHVALSRGKELVGPKGTWTVKTVHRDYTAILVDPKEQLVLVEEDSLREMVKLTKKAEAAPARPAPKTDAEKMLKASPGIFSSCGCTEDEPCVDEDTGATCSWANKEKTLCSTCAAPDATTLKEVEKALVGATAVSLLGHHFLPRKKGKGSVWACDGCGYVTAKPARVTTPCKKAKAEKKKGK